MLMNEPPQEKVQFTFFSPFYHHRFSKLEEPNPSTWKAWIAKYSHPFEEEEIDHAFSWRFVHEKYVQPEGHKRFF